MRCWPLSSLRGDVQAANDKSIFKNTISSASLASRNRRGRYKNYLRVANYKRSSVMHHFYFRALVLTMLGRIISLLWIIYLKKKTMNFSTVVICILKPFINSWKSWWIVLRKLKKVSQKKNKFLKPLQELQFYKKQKYKIFDKWIFSNCTVPLSSSALLTTIIYGKLNQVVRKFISILDRQADTDLWSVQVAQNTIKQSSLK